MSRKTRQSGKRTGGNAVPARPAQDQGGLGWLFCLLLVVVTVLAFLPAWRAGFIWDDDRYVTENHTLHSAAGLAQIWTQLTATPQYYPLVHTSFWMEYHLWGLDPVGFHVDNVLLHALAAVLLWRVLLRLRVPGAWLAAAIFALHPVTVESVAWVTERKNVLSAVFYFAAALAYWRWRGPDGEEQKPARGSLRWYGIALGLFIAALLSKTVTCSLPAALLLVIWWKRGRIAGRDGWPLVPFFVMGAGMGLMTSWLERSHVGASGPEWAFSFAERCLIAGRALWFSAGKLIWPGNLAFIYPRWQINTGIWWQWLFPVAVVAVVVVLFCLRRRIGRGPVVAVLFFCGTLFPALGFSNIYPMRYTFVADHYQYLACVGLIVLAVAALAKFRGQIPLAAVMVPLGLGVLTCQRAAVYHDPETVWRDTLKKNPGCWMAEDNLGNILIREGQVDEAMVHYHRALELNVDDADTHYNLGVALAHQQQLGAAISELEQAVRLNPRHVKALNNLGIALAMTGRVDEAIGHFNKALELEPDFATTHLNLAIALSRQNRLDEGIDQVQQFLKTKPDDADALKLLESLKARKQGGSATDEHR